MNAVSQGSLLIAILLSFSAGIISFLSPCVLPLVPGYLSFITGFGLEANTTVRKSKALLATLLFISGFTFVFVCIGMFFGGIGGWFLLNGRIIERIMGIFVILLGLSYLGVWNLFNREFRFHTPVKQGIAGAPFMGALFAIGWTPCIGPTLAAVQSLAFNQATVGRGALLSAVYGFGLGLPFLIITFALEKALVSVRWLRQHQLKFLRTGGVFLIVIGLLLTTGMWSELTVQMRVLVSGFTPLL
ncbi:MAG: cytochrome c biogenesis protein CcdA [Candidatus Nanopelagicales bacterium]|jgi:cytochrome c-type biogenesis protein|nr:cytochrome c biogenesis protein CcdA [Candidatus Nanopelagicales bacterium]MBJ7393135.1 cytochrome c biogenesis protein CcdA [Candidatus Nanopelagicales bacterium]